MVLSVHPKRTLSLKSLNKLFALILVTLINHTMLHCKKLLHAALIYKNSVQLNNDHAYVAKLYTCSVIWLYALREFSVKTVVLTIY